MKKITIWGIVFFFTLFSFYSCKKPPSRADQMLQLVPKQAKGVFYADFQKILETDAAKKAIKEAQGEKYQKIIQASQIDPEKDLYAMVIAWMGKTEQPDQQGLAIFNLNYSKDTLLSLAREKGPELSTEKYNGITIYSTLQKQKKKGSFAFLDDTHVVVGNPHSVKEAIDVSQNKKENIFKNKSISELLTKTNQQAMFWGGILFPPEAMEKISSDNPMLRNLKSLHSASLYIDYKNKNLITEIKITSRDEGKIQELVDLLNGVKALGSMAGGKKPQFEELMKKIEITAQPDHIKIYAQIPDELLNQLSKKTLAE